MNVKNSHTASRNFVTGILLLHEAMFPNYNKERSMEGGFCDRSWVVEVVDDEQKFKVVISAGRRMHKTILCDL